MREMGYNIRELDYQRRVMDVVARYLDTLKECKNEVDKVETLAKQNPNVSIPIPDFTQSAWEKLQAQNILPPSRADVAFSPRKDGTQKPVPNITLKVPTGGGKTYLAVRGLSDIFSKYLTRNTGFVLWVVPNEAIYTQTLKNLTNLDHPYRKALNVVAANRVKIFERTNVIRKEEIESHLCIMLLMLQASNRQNKESLKMFQDRGDVHGFFPEEGNQQTHKDMLENTPNLSDYGDDMFVAVHKSLGNALRIIRPVVVLDEGHRAMSDLAHETLYGFNPCFVMELTATPKDGPTRKANVLADVSGVEVDREGMIKMPINLDARQSMDWKATLQAGLDRLDSLKKQAQTYQANADRYIRPIMLVQVERTGNDQRESNFIHAEDVKERLLSLGFDEAEIAIKTSQKNDLASPENQDLLSPANRVRVIITKQALQEGWDCSFAYVLCSLAASANRNAMTQLIGRILRQPAAEKTNIDALNSCYVITHHAQTGDVVSTIKDGLEKGGLGDLTAGIVVEGGVGTLTDIQIIKRRDKFEETKIYLPKVMIQEGETIRELDYQTDILAKLDWGDCEAAAFAKKIPKNYNAAENQMQAIAVSEAGLTSQTVGSTHEGIYFDPIYATRHISDIVLNCFVGRQVVMDCTNALDQKGIDSKKRDKLSGLIITELRKHLLKICDKKAETLFRENVEAGKIQFYLRSSSDDWIMPPKVPIAAKETDTHLFRNDQTPLQMSLFAPVFAKELNGDEQKVAVYLDEAQTIKWWHRNVAMRHYYLQGWRQHKIYPDFIFAKETSSAGTSLAVIETKGDQLANNLDSEYKRKLMDYLSEKFDWNKLKTIGKHELVMEDGTEFEAKLVLMSEWETELSKLIDTG